MIRSAFFLAFFSLCLSLLAGSRVEQERFIHSISDPAIDMMVEHRIPASVTIAQAVHESNYGQSELATNANNFFGMQCGSATVWSGDCYRKVDYDKNGKPYSAQFRIYNSVEECFEDRIAFLSKERYQSLYNLHVADYYNWIKGLKAAGYAEDKAYVNKLDYIINKFNLTQYDKKGLAILKQASHTSLAQIQEPEVFFARGKTYDVFPSDYRPGIYNQNNVAMVIAAPNMTLADISKNTGLSEAQLRQYNDMTESQQLITFQYVFLEPKKEISKVAETHIVKNDETMYVIAQSYGIQLEYLLQLNKLKRGQLPARGEIIQLNIERKNSPKIRIRKTHEYQPISYRPTAKPNPKHPSINHVYETTRQTHIVQRGDTVFNICMRYNITEQQLREWNNLNSTIIHINDLLFVEGD